MHYRDIVGMERTGILHFILKTLLEVVQCHLIGDNT